MYTAKRLFRDLSLFIEDHLLGFIILTCVSAFILIACFFAPKLTEGQVIDRRHTAERTEMRIQSTTDSKGHVSVSSYPIYHPEQFEIKVVGLTEKGEERAEWWTVSQYVYLAAELSDHAIRNPQTGVVSIQYLEAE